MQQVRILTPSFHFRLPYRKNESKRLEQVLQHPQFIADPLAAITRHLQSTLPEPASKKHVDIKGNRKLKKQKKKPNNGK